MKFSRRQFILLGCVALAGCGRPGSGPVATVSGALGSGGSTTGPKIQAATLSADGRTLATANADFSITLWDLTTGRVSRTLTGHKGGVTSLAFSADGTTLASGGGEGRINVWSVAAGSLSRVIAAPGGTDALAVSPNGAMIASGGNDGMVQLWQSSDGKQLQRMSGHTGAVRTLAFNPTGQSVATGGQDTGVRLWATGTGQELHRLTGHGGEIESIGYSRDGRSLASGSADQTIKVWEVEQGQESKSLSGHTGAVSAVAFSPNGQELASGSADRTIKLWDLSKGTQERTLTGHTDAIPAVSFSADSRTVVSGSFDNSSRTWDAVSGQQQRSLDLRPVANTPSAPPNPTVTTVVGARTLPLNGQPLGFAITAPKQQIAWTFAGTAGQQISATVQAKGLGGSDIALSGPDGAFINSRYLDGEGFLDSTRLPTTGTYTLTFATRDGGTGAGTITAYSFADTVGTTTLDGTPMPFAITMPGQNARWTFTVGADQKISVVASAKAVGEADIVVLAADESQLGSSYLNGEGFLDAVAFPAPGTYTLVFNPRDANTGTGTLTAYAVTDAVGTIVPGGPAVPLNITTPGQNARFRFEGKAGQRISATATAKAVGEADIILRQPDGTQLQSRYLNGAGFFDAVALPLDGTYTLIFDPRGTNTGTGTLTAYSVNNTSGTITIDGPAVPVAITAPGQNAALTFTGRAGQQLNIVVAAKAIGECDVSIVKPDGAVLIERYVNGDGSVEATLPNNGTYTLIYNPRDTNTGTGTIGLTTKR
ncbi:MAG TPA: WD40 repeat domain-containing protein [Thermomicrobiales bacterium]|jgi:uncharacterized protein YjiK